MKDLGTEFWDFSENNPINFFAIGLICTNYAEIIHLANLNSPPHTYVVPNSITKCSVPNGIRQAQSSVNDEVIFANYKSNRNIIKKVFLKCQNSQH
jgi:hypothetical protein